MKAELKLTFETRSDLEEHIEQIQDGENALSALNDFYNNVIRPVVKQGLGEYTDEQRDVYEEIADKFWEILRENQVNL